MKDINCKNNNRRKLLSLSRISGLTTIITLIAVTSALFSIGASGADSAKKSVDTPIVTKCKADLAKRLKIQAKEIKAVDVKAVTWPDAALGMPETGKMYAQMQTPGKRVILEGRGKQYLYTTSTKAFRYGGPVSAWSYSMLYLQPVENEANLNGDLYQCSLLGTNSIRLASGVTDYYPQDKGMVIIKRRTSRSFHDLLYVKANKPGKEKKLYTGMDFGDAAVNNAQDQWAALVKPGVGAAWTVVVGCMSQDASKIKTLSMPEGVQPGRIAWSGETLMILDNKNDFMIAYETSLKDEAPEWKKVAAHLFPGLPDLMLNKSESLSIDQVEEDGKPAVEVARVWFTGDRNVVVKIDGVTMQGFDLLGPYVFIYGDKDSRPAAYTVDIGTGESIVSGLKTGRSIRSFTYPPHGSPLYGDAL